MAFDIPLADQMRIALNYVKFKTREKRLRTAEKVITDTIYGKVKGVKWQSIYGTTYYSFEGIPFAKPPIGTLRFKAPVEPDPWSDVRRCTRIRSKPCQVNILMKQVQGKEDCLYLNVYTRMLHPKEPLPVLVWIYGGGFQMGEASRDLYSPDYFMLENVVLVTIAYRLGALGFLSLSDQNLDVPGNAGLKDQVLALKWVKQNCKFFGGDRESITVFGESAGGCSTQYMMITEQTRDLFHKAVIMSGSTLAPWANIPPRNWAFRLARATGYRGDENDSDVLSHLRNCKTSTLLKVSEGLLTPEERQERMIFSFGPCVEPYVTEHCVIPRAPLEMMRNCWGNQIPLLIGGNSFEGLLSFSEVRKYPELLLELNDCESVVPIDAQLNEEKRKEFGKLIKQTYFGEKEPCWATILMYSDLFSYKYFWHGIHRTLLSRVHNATAPTYLYRFDFDSKHFNFMRIITCGRKQRGTCHADDLSYMFYNAGAKKLKHFTAEYRTIRRLIAILVQFATHGNPNIPPEAETSDGDNITKVASSGDRGSGVSNIIEMVGEVGKGSGEVIGGSLELAEIGVKRSADIKSDDIPSVNDAAAGKKRPEQISTSGPPSTPPSPSSPSFPDRTSASAVSITSLSDDKADNNPVSAPDIWLPLCKDDKVFKCLNISDELEIIDLPEAEKLRLWDSMYEREELLF